MKRIKRTCAISVGTIFVFLSSISAQDWKDVLKTRLPEFGHRNWIIVADAAYPKQSARGIETIYTKAGQLEILQEVLKEINKSTHVKPVVMLDKELEFVKDESAPGVQNYCTKLTELLRQYHPNVMQHEDIIKKLDDRAQMFNILLLKSNMAIPYTTVFIELDCGYWNAEKENELRRLLKNKEDK